jgi:hypothetical protein
MFRDNKSDRGRRPGGMCYGEVERAAIGIYSDARGGAKIFVKYCCRTYFEKWT